MPDRDARRRFGRRERAALLLAAAGRCAPIVAGLTQISMPTIATPGLAAMDRRDQGQALRPTCDRRKSNTPAVSTAPATGPIHTASDPAAAGAAPEREQPHPRTRSRYLPVTARRPSAIRKSDERHQQ